MTVKIAKKPLNGAFGLPESTRVVLTLIDGGMHWLEYAIGEQEGQYAFRDDGHLVAAVQTGLHATPYLLIDAIGLMVAPVKLMTMSPDDLQLLHGAAIGEVPPGSPDLLALLARYDLATQGHLASVDGLLGNLEIAAAPMFQAMDIHDRLALLALSRDARVTSTALPELRLEAASFAVSQASSAREFVDYFSIFIDHVAVIDAPQDTPLQRRARVKRAVDTLSPMMFQALDCPEVAGQPSPVAVEQAITDWLMDGRQLGFSRVSQGVHQIVANTDFATEDGLAAQLIVRDYLNRAQQLVRLQGIGRLSMGQDGATCLFPIIGAGQEAVVRLDPSGAITLAQFRRIRPPHPDGAARSRPDGAPRSRPDGTARPRPAGTARPRPAGTPGQADGTTTGRVSSPQAAARPRPPGGPRLKIVRLRKGIAVS